MKRNILGSALTAIVASALIAGGCAGFGGGDDCAVGGPGDTTAPTIISTSPTNGDQSASTSKRITATFSEPIDGTSLTEVSFKASSPAGPLTGDVATFGNTALLQLSNTIPVNTVVTATITKAIRDKSGNTLANTYTWTFKTTANGDTVRPTVSGTDPDNGATGVALNKAIVAIFSEAMDPRTLTASSFTVRGPNGAVAGAVTLVNNVASFKSTVNLKPSSTYTATITTAAQDLSDNNLAVAKVWTFTTGALQDTTAPTVTSTDPSASATGVATNKTVTASFSEALDSATVNSTTFTLTRPDNSVVSSTITYVNQVALLNPSSALAPNTVYTANLSTGVKDSAGNQLAAAKRWSFTTAATGDTTPPTISSTDPANRATGVAVNKRIVAVFSENMDSRTLTTTTFKVRGPSGAVAGAVSLLNNVASFKSTADLAQTTTYTVTITTGVQDLSGNRLAVEKVWTFTTGTNPDTTPPLVTATDPDASQTGIPTNKTVTATFNEALDSASVNSTTFTLKRPDGSIVPSTISYANKVAILNPTTSLSGNTVYTANLSTGVTDSAGNPLATAKIWTFRTAATGDVTPPTVLSTKPADRATNVFRNQSINATFSESMRADTLNTSTFSVVGVIGTVSYNTLSRIATFNPTGDLAANTTYTARIETGAKDAAGNGLANPKTWTFTTGVQRSQTTIDLGAAGTYAVLAGSTVTNAGLTIINGDLGVSPGTAVTGFPPGKVNGAIHAGDSAAARAKSDLLAAQLDAAGRLGGAALPGDLAGLTFTPGLYKNSTSVMLSSGKVTLDAQGDVNAVFIFQMGSTLTTSPGTQVVLAGGAQASNVYWSVGSSATLGVDSIFKGIILSEVSITVNTGAVNEGTLLTKIGAVTLQKNTITRRPKLP